MLPAPSGAQLSRRTCAVQPGSASVRADCPLLPRMKMSLLSDGNPPSQLSGSSWNFSRLELWLTGIVCSAALPLSLRLPDSHREVWGTALSFKALKGVTHCSSFVCSLTSFCCTASPPASTDFCTELVKRGFKLWVNSGRFSHLHFTLLTCSRLGADARWGFYFLRMQPHILNLSLIILISFLVPGEA